MPFWLFLAEISLISLSGVMAPGPMTTVIIGKGNQSPHAGALIAVGHGIVEFPLMVAVYFGIGYLLNLPTVKASIALVGGAFLLWMGIGMLRNIRQAALSEKDDARSPILAGILLSLGNPYFLIWWATVGVALVLRSAEFGLIGFLVLAVTHWLCDFGWAYFLSALAFKGGQFFGKRFQQVVFALCGVLLLYFSGKLVLDAIKDLLGNLPV